MPDAEPTSPENRAPRPLVALTLGDVSGIGPEVVARAWADPRLHEVARPFVVGDRSILRQALTCVGSDVGIQPITGPEEADPSLRRVPCLDAASLDLGGSTLR